MEQGWLIIREPSVELIEERDTWKRLELIGRVCYKSEHKITDDSAVHFANLLYRRGHFSVFEHLWGDYKLSDNENPPSMSARHWLSTGEGLKDLLDNFELDSDYLSIRFICDRGIANQLVRHRNFCFMQESTRYVSYRKEMCVIRPVPFDWADGGANTRFSIWEQSMLSSMRAYNDLIDRNVAPQEARTVLPLSLKTELIMTGSVTEFASLFLARTTPACHPQIVHLMKLMRDFIPEVDARLKLVEGIL